MTGHCCPLPSRGAIPRCHQLGCIDSFVAPTSAWTSGQPTAWPSSPMKQPIGFYHRIQEAIVRLSTRMLEPLASGYAQARRRLPVQQQALLLPWTRAPRHCLPPSWTLRWPTDAAASIDSTERGCHHPQHRRVRTGPCSSSGRSSSDLSCCRCLHWHGRCLSAGFH